MRVVGFDPTALVKCAANACSAPQNYYIYIYIYKKKYMTKNLCASALKSTHFKKKIYINIVYLY